MLPTFVRGLFSRAVQPVVLLAVIVLSVSLAWGQPAGFVEDFSGPMLDPAFSQGGNLASHPGAITGTYDMTHVNGDPDGGTKLNRSTPGTLSSYTHTVEVILNPFRLSANPGTQTDLKVKSFGADGFMEFVLNSFGDMRLFHNDSDGGGGNIQPNTNIGYADGDLLQLTTVYDQGTDTIDVTYALNGGTPVNYYSGGGVDGPIGDLITSFVEVEVFKWGSSEPTQPVVAIDSWSLVPVPEPASSVWSTIALFAVCCRCRRVLRRS